MRRVHLSGCGYSSRGLVAVHLSQVNLATVPLLIARVAQIIIARGTVVVGASAALATGITNPAGGVASLSVLSVLEYVPLCDYWFLKRHTQSMIADDDIPQGTRNEERVQEKKHVCALERG